jgi:hypothetical protein
MCVLLTVSKTSSGEKKSRRINREFIIPSPSILGKRKLNLKGKFLAE